jgi:hypothetical protein
MPRQLVEVNLWFCSGCRIVTALAAHVRLLPTETEQPIFCPHCDMVQTHNPVAIARGSGDRAVRFVTTTE